MAVASGDMVSLVIGSVRRAPAVGTGQSGVSMAIVRMPMLSSAAALAVAQRATAGLAAR